MYIKHRRIMQWKRHRKPQKKRERERERERERDRDRDRETGQRQGGREKAIRETEYS